MWFKMKVCCVLFLKMGELKANHEAMKLELQNSHVEQLQCVKQQYEMSLEGEWTVLAQTIQTVSILRGCFLWLYLKLTQAERVLSVF